MIKERPARKSTGFALFNYWHGLYQEITGKALPPLNKITAQGKALFNSRLVTLKGMYGWETPDLKKLMLFALMHDPLQIGVDGYGNLNNLIGAARFFAAWRKEHKAEIDAVGEARAIYHSMPASGEALPDLTEFMEAFDEGSFGS